MRPTRETSYEFETGSDDLGEAQGILQVHLRQAEITVIDLKLVTERLDDAPLFP
jgi:hypothetical protein